VPRIWFRRVLASWDVVGAIGIHSSDHHQDEVKRLDEGGGGVQKGGQFQHERNSDRLILNDQGQDGVEEICFDSELLKVVNLHERIAGGVIDAAHNSGVTPGGHRREKSGFLIVSRGKAEGQDLRSLSSSFPVVVLSNQSTGGVAQFLARIFKRVRNAERGERRSHRARDYGCVRVAIAAQNKSGDQRSITRLNEGTGADVEKLMKHRLKGEIKAAGVWDKRALGPGRSDEQDVGGTTVVHDEQIAGAIKGEPIWSAGDRAGEDLGDKKIARAVDGQSLRSCQSGREDTPCAPGREFENCAVAGGVARLRDKDITFAVKGEAGRVIQPRCKNGLCSGRTIFHYQAIAAVGQVKISRGRRKS